MIWQPTVLKSVIGDFQSPALLGIHGSGLNSRDGKERGIEHAGVFLYKMGSTSMQLR